MTDTVDIDTYFKDTGLAQGKVLDCNVIYHTKTRQYVMGTLGFTQSCFEPMDVMERYVLDDYQTPAEYRQMVLERFEDWVKELEADGFMVDYDAEHI